MIMAQSQEWVVIQNQGEGLKATKKTSTWRMDSKDKELEAVEAHEVEEVCPLIAEEEVASLDLVQVAE